MNDDTTIKQLCTWSALGVLGDALTRIQALYCDLFGQGSKNAFELAEVGKCQSASKFDQGSASNFDQGQRLFWRCLNR
jgi:hypothetical protein